MKIYISGPITGTRDYMRRFQDLENALVAAGHTVLNPARVMANLPMGTTHEEYMRTSITLMSMCDTVFFQNGWEDSMGCREEMDYAVQHRLTIVFQGGKECQRKVNSVRHVSSAQKHGKKYMQEIISRVFSAKLATR